MIDTHAHLYSKQFNDDRDEVIKRSVENGVNYLVIPAIEKKSFASLMELCNKYPGICFPTVGLHPTSVKDDYEQELAFVEEQLNQKNNFVAIGEIGIDCHWSLEHIVQQRDAFERQVKLAEQNGLPVIIHAREAFHEIFPILDRIHNPNVKGVFHSFAGTVEDYYKIKEYQTFKIGIGGVVTFKNSDLPNVVNIIPIEEIVLETDAPYLAPHPYRGKRNESSYIPLIAQKIAEIKNISIAKVDEITTNNAKELFNLK